MSLSRHIYLSTYPKTHLEKLKAKHLQIIGHCFASPDFSQKSKLSLGPANSNSKLAFIQYQLSKCIYLLEINTLGSNVLNS